MPNSKTNLCLMQKSESEERPSAYKSLTHLGRLT